MQPTMKLRIVLRQVLAPEYGPNISIKKEVHQQWWAVWCDGQETPTGEWRDIEVQNEQDIK